MRSGSRLPFAVLLTLTSASAVFAQQPQQQPAPLPATQPAAQPPAEQTPEQNPDQPQKYEEVVVVTASKTEEKLINAPATMTVINSQTIQSAPTQNFAELLRAVPGVNITQVSARDINVTARGATSTLATGQLALLDGRSLYQDFFGFVMWDFLPVNLNEVKQVEVISGPASAVWGANALYGVVNVISKSPREMQGAAFTMGVGGFDRSTNDSAESAGTVFYISGTYAQAVNDRWAYKLSAGGYMQDAMPRPTGTIPCDMPEVCKGPKNPYPPFNNQGTTQPKFDARVDYDYENGAKLSFSGGVAGTNGIMESGIGPFDINNGSAMGYVKANYTRQGFRAGFFSNILNGDADNLLTRDLQGNPIVFTFRTRTYDFEASNVQTFRQKHVVTYGGNLRFNTFDLSLAPAAQNRTEGGGYIQDEIFLSNTYRLVAGARVDRFDYLDSFVFSPRVTFMIKPHEDQTVRVSYNRAYRSPSVVNNFLDVVIAEPIDLSPFAPLNPALKGQIYPLPVRSVGNPLLQETSMDAFEVGYTGVVAHGKAVVTAAVYVNRIGNDILFTEDLSKRYVPTNPPPGWPLPPFTLGPPFLPSGLPAEFTYLNFGRTIQRGLELGVTSPVTSHVTAFANYSYQGKPDVNFDLSEVNLPPTNRFNIGFNFSRDRYIGDLTVTHAGGAYWQDVLDDRYHGTTDPYTLVNGGAGVRWAHNRLTTSVKVINLFNENALEHVFGDILKRQVVGELRVQF
jgi:outer membrane receptor protein involved in Fe transport